MIGGTLAVFLLCIWLFATDSPRADQSLKVCLLLYFACAALHSAEKKGANGLGHNLRH